MFDVAAVRMLTATPAIFQMVRVLNSEYSVVRYDMHCSYVRDSPTVSVNRPLLSS